MPSIPLVLALVALAALGAVPARAAVDGPDVALTVLAYEGRRLVARASAKGRFGERLLAAKDGTMRVEMVVEAPDDEGYSHLRMTRFKWVNGAREREPDFETCRRSFASSASRHGDSAGAS